MKWTCYVLVFLMHEAPWKYRNSSLQKLYWTKDKLIKLWNKLIHSISTCLFFRYTSNKLFILKAQLIKDGREGEKLGRSHFLVNLDAIHLGIYTWTMIEPLVRLVIELFFNNGPSCKQLTYVNCYLKTWDAPIVCIPLLLVREKVYYFLLSLNCVNMG